MQQLMEATAEQLERSTAAGAAAAAAGSGAGSVAAAAADLTGPATAASGAPLAETRVGMLACTAGQLLSNYTLFHSLRTTAHDVVSTLGNVQSAAAHLSAASMRHISAVLQHHHHQQQQQETPPKSLLSLANGLAYSIIMGAKVMGTLHHQLGPHALVGRGPHFVIWCDMALLLAAYANILQQKGELPITASMADSAEMSPGAGRESAGSSAAAGSSSSSSSSSSKTRQQQQQSQRRSGRSALASSNPGDDLLRAAEAWQVVQGQWERTPASHKQLLEKIGVSPQAAVWLAANMAKFGLPITLPSVCWEWNPHYVVTAADHGHVEAGAAPPNTAAVSAIREVRAQVQQWDSTPLRALLQPVLLYDLAYAKQDEDYFIWACYRAMANANQFQRQHMLAMQQWLTRPASSGRTLISYPTTLDELLLLALPSIQRLQQLEAIVSACSSLPPTSAADVVRFHSPAERVKLLAQADSSGRNFLVSLAITLVMREDAAHSQQTQHQRRPMFQRCGSPTSPSKKQLCLRAALQPWGRQQQGLRTQAAACLCLLCWLNRLVPSSVSSRHPCGSKAATGTSRACWSSPGN
jgi:hypothetical protein